MVDTDLAAGDTFNKKIRNAQLAQYNYILGKFNFNAHYNAFYSIVISPIEIIPLRSQDHKQIDNG